MIIVARQLIEKTWQHDDCLFLLFVDLKKEYDAVQQAALWSVFAKCGIPLRMLNVSSTKNVCKSSG